MRRPRLRGVGDRPGGLTDKAQALVPGFKDGNFSTGDIRVLAAELAGVTALAKTLGVDVKELPVPNLGT